MLCPSHPFLPSRPTSKHWAFYCLQSFTFSGALAQSWNHSVLKCFQLVFFHFHLVVTIQLFSMFFCALIAHFLLSLNNILFFFFWMYEFVHSPKKVHLGCFQVLAITNKSTIYLHVQVIVYTCIFSLLR